MKSPKTVGPAVAVSLVAATVAALALMSEAAPAGPTENVVDADVSPVNPLPYTESFGSEVTRSAFAFENYPWRLALDVEPTHRRSIFNRESESTLVPQPIPS
ncbi:hypothetical protein [Bradyrhizobium sp. CCBAU 51753]|uniref:hypothetical protein n=1 Tax=Bradyrhizobium sp. CCBAU 51753 TaxID=1325100 RepID=UPI00188A3386|nr:hypothetical protein [Bradyrhizobium sp. CCBAU 51753]